MSGAARLGRVFELVFALAGLFFMTGGLTFALTPPGALEAPMVQTMGMGIGVLALLGLLVRPLSLNRVLVLYWPALLLVAFAVFSLVWSVNWNLTLRRGGSLVLTTMFAFWLVERFDHRTLLRFFVTTAAALCIGCWFVILTIPSMGIHQVTDAIGWEHAGSWRGLYFHKNDFGRAIALAAVVFVVASTIYRRWAWLFVLMTLQACVMIALSNSSQAILLAIVPAGVYLTIFWLRTKSVATRTVVISVMVPLLVIVYMLSDIVFGAVLEALGKDATLTGRTEIWTGVLTAVGPNFLGGGGFGAGWDLVGDRVAALTAIVVGHAHNGYLDLVTDLGVIGLGLVLAFAGWVFRQNFRAIFVAPDWPIASLGFAYAVFYFIGNWAGSFLMLHNSIYWVLLITSFCCMRNLFNPYANWIPQSKVVHVRPGPDWQPKPVGPRQLRPDPSA